MSFTADCRGKHTGKPSGRYCCGDGDGEIPVGCYDDRCNQGSDWQCSEFVGPGSCCGDGTCGGSENSFNCAVDCGDCPGGTSEICNDGVDNNCDGAIDCRDSLCTSNSACQSSCGDGVCEAGETCADCGDCSGRQTGAPSGRYCCGNGVAEGPEGDGAICDNNS